MSSKRILNVDILFAQVYRIPCSISNGINRFLNGGDLPI